MASLIAGMLNITDADNTVIGDVGQSIVYTAAEEFVAKLRAQLVAQSTLLVARQTEKFQEYYKGIGGGYMQQRGRFTQVGATKAGGRWAVAYPLYDWSDQKAWNDIDVRYMTVADFDLQLNDTITKNLRTRRREMLRPIFNNAVMPFEDDIEGPLSVQPLANQDGTLYPPVVGTDDEGELNNYIVSGYAVSSVSDANNPVATAVARLESVFGQQAMGSNVVTFVHSGALLTKLLGLTDFAEVRDQYLILGTNMLQSTGQMPNVPGVVRGRLSGSWIVQWDDAIPDGYMFSIHMDAPGPLVERVDPARTGIPRGLHFIEPRDMRFPLEALHARDRFGYGVGERRNGVVTQVKASGSYDIPAAYA